MNEDNIRETLQAHYLKTRPNRMPSEKSINLYIRNFLKIYEECFSGDEKYVDNFEWISEIDTIRKWFADTGKSVPTIRNYITALLIVSSGLDKIPQKIYTEWEVIRDGIVDKERKSVKALKSDNQEEQYIDAQIIIDQIKEMGKNVKLIAKKSEITNEDRKLVQLWMILRILHVYHMRNEVATFKMISLREYKKLAVSVPEPVKQGGVGYLNGKIKEGPARAPKANTFSLKENYVVYDSGKGEWFISANSYKTVKKYGEKITIVEDKSLSKDLTLFRKINGWGIMFKNSFKSNSPLNPNDLSKLLAKWSKQVLPKIEVSSDDGETTILKDRSISTTMLAKIFYSAEQGQAKQDLMKKAKARGHDVKTAMNVYTATPEEIANLNSS